MSAADILAEAAETYRARNAVYGDNFMKVGKIMEALFPDGIVLSTADDHNRFHIFALAVIKMTRYVQNWNAGGHKDSIHDMTVYCAMLESIDSIIEKSNVEMPFFNEEINEPAPPPLGVMLADALKHRTHK